MRAALQPACRLRREESLPGGRLCFEDRGLLCSLGGQDRGAAVTLGAHLLLHGVLDREGRVDGLELDTSNANTPFSGGLVEDYAQLPVDVVAAGESFFEVQPTDDISEGGGRELLNSTEIVRDLICRGASVCHLEVDDRVDRDDQVIFGDHRLRRERHDLLAHVDERTKPVDERHEDVQTRHERLVVAAQAFDDASGGLRNDPDGPCDSHHHEDDDRDGENPSDCGGDERGFVHGVS
ncbi:hypothetical protein DC31_14800 [Microbacterium sp. CH12i]|nr:hypothetical protein DC31_14800 [Microbacterium sp. CH12i]